MYVCAIIVLLKLTCNVRNLMFDLHILHIYLNISAAHNALPTEIAITYRSSLCIHMMNFELKLKMS